MKWDYKPRIISKGGKLCFAPAPLWRKAVGVLIGVFFGMAFLICDIIDGKGKR